MAALAPVIFRFSARLAPAARTVSVLGSFNHWDPTVHLLHRTVEGDWQITIYLPPGRILYLFSVDGVTWLDPDDDDRAANGWGSEYSVRRITLKGGGGADDRSRDRKGGRASWGV